MQTTKNEKTTNDDLSGLFEIWEASYKAILGLLEKRKLNYPGLVQALNGINTQIFYFSAKNTEQILFKLRALVDYFQEKDDRLACEEHLAPLQQRLENLGKTRVQAIPSEVAIAPASNLALSSQSLHTMPSELCEKIASFLPADDVLKLAASSCFFSTTLSHLRQEALSSFSRIIVGNAHTLVHYLSGEVYSFGENNSGQLGSGDTQHQHTPQKIPLPNNKKVKQVVAGASHTLILYEDGQVYGFGKNTEGQLGLGNTPYQSTPEKIPLPNKKVKQLTAGGHTSFIICEDSKVLAFGWNSNGELGLGHTQVQNTPQEVILLPKSAQESTEKRCSRM